jgi:hypothetical protein
MATPLPLQTTFLHAAVYSSLFLQMAQQLFPQQPYLVLSEDQRRVAQNETDNLLTRSKWRLESKVFQSSFGTPFPFPPDQAVPAGTVLGEMTTPAGPGQTTESGTKGYL